MSCDPTPKSEDSVPDDLLSEVAYLRARGRSWDDAAREIGWDATALRRALRTGTRYRAAYETAAREAEREAEAELLQKLRAQMNDPDPVVSRRATENLLRFLSARRRDQTRMEVERLRGARSAPRAKGAEEPPARPPEPAVAEVRETEITRTATMSRDRPAAGTPPTPKVNAPLAAGRGSLSSTGAPRNAPVAPEG